MSKKRTNISRTRSAFGEWFEAQYGVAPKRSIPEINEDIVNTEYRLAVLKQEFHVWEVYESHKSAALSAWAHLIN